MIRHLSFSFLTLLIPLSMAWSLPPEACVNSLNNTTFAEAIKNLREPYGQGNSYEDKVKLNDQLTQKLQMAINALATPAQVLEYIEVYSATPLLGEISMVSFQSLNLAKAIRRIQKAQPAADWTEVDQKLTELETQERHQIIISRGREVTRTSPLLSLRLLFHPDQAIAYIDRMLSKLPNLRVQQQTLGDAFLGRNGFDEISPNMAEVFSALTGHPREHLKSELRKLLQTKDKDLRREYEALLRMMNEDSLRSLTEQLHIAGNPNVDQAMETYFQSIQEGWIPDKTVLSWAQVRNILNILSADLAPQLKDQEFIEIFGSLPNGKADPATSDVDFALANPLQERLFGKTMAQIMADAQWATLYFSDVITRHFSVPAMQKFEPAYLKAEKDLNTLWNRKEGRSQMLATAYPKNQPQQTIVRWYNPISIRIYANHLEIVVTDFVENYSNPEVVHHQLRE